MTSTLQPTTTSSFSTSNSSSSPSPSPPPTHTTLCKPDENAVPPSSPSRTSQTAPFSNLTISKVASPPPAKPHSASTTASQLTPPVPLTQTGKSPLRTLKQRLRSKSHTSKLLSEEVRELELAKAKLQGEIDGLRKVRDALLDQVLQSVKMATKIRREFSTAAPPPLQQQQPQRRVAPASAISVAQLMRSARRGQGRVLDMDAASSPSSCSSPPVSDDEDEDLDDLLVRAGNHVARARNIPSTPYTTPSQRPAAPSLGTPAPPQMVLISTPAPPSRTNVAAPSSVETRRTRLERARQEVMDAFEGKSLNAVNREAKEIAFYKWGAKSSGAPASAVKERARQAARNMPDAPLPGSKGTSRLPAPSPARADRAHSGLLVFSPARPGPNKSPNSKAKAKPKTRIPRPKSARRTPSKTRSSRSARPGSAPRRPRRASVGDEGEPSSADEMLWS